jgi:hypothetical protein
MAVPLTLSSVPAQTPYIQYIASANQTVFPYPFEITQDSDLICLVNGVELMTDQGYTLSGQGTTVGGNLTFTLGQLAGTIVTLYRDITIARITQLAQNGTFFSSNFNNEFNRIYLIMQQLQESIGFSLQIPNTNAGLAANQTTLTPANYAGKYLSFDANGNPIPATLTSSGTITQTLIGSTLFPQTIYESNAGVVPVNFFYPPGVIDRYGTNTTPGTTDMLTAINNAILVSAAGGGDAFGFGTTYFHSAPITMKALATLRGSGKFTTIFLGTDTGNGVATTSPINSATTVATVIRDCRFVNTNGSNTGGGVVDVGGTEVTVYNVSVNGHAYGIILDQSELADVDLCSIDQFATGGIWLVNGADHTALANAGYTNRISVKRTQINGDGGAAFAAKGTAIIDDGGTCHSFVDNNLNACVAHYRIAGADVVDIANSEHESSTGNTITFATTTSVLGTSVGVSNNIRVRSNYASPGSGVFAALASSVVSIVLTDNRTITSTPCVTGCSTANTIISYANQDSGSGDILDGVASSGHLGIEVGGAHTNIKNTNISLTGTVAVIGGATFAGVPGFAGNAAPAQSTGWGTPTNGGVFINFPGSTATLAQTGQAVSQLIIALKALGVLGA